jgi:hypothetical protein
MIKQILLLLVLSSLLAFSQCEESFMKMRIYREFISDLFSKNMGLIFSQVQPSISVKDVYLPELNTAMKNFHLHITSPNYSQSEIEDMINVGDD